jgi:TolB-like protein
VLTSDVPSATPDLPASSDAPQDPEQEAAAEIKAKKKREKVRSAWISFVGRIVAQLAGAMTTVALGLAAVQHYGMASGTPDAVRPRTDDEARAQSPPPRSVNDGRPAVVVLPFANFSTEAALEPVVDGLTESLVAELARAGSLRVVSRTSSMHYKGSRQALREIARELDVDLVVEGSVSEFKGRVRVVAQLIDAYSDDHVWVQSYERGLGDVLELQESVARVIAQEVNRAALPHLLSTSEGYSDRASVASSQRIFAGR